MNGSVLSSILAYLQMYYIVYSHFLILQIIKDTYAQLNVYYSLHKFQIKEKLLLSFTQLFCY